MLKRANILLLYIEYINNVTVYGDCSKENLHFGKLLMTLSYNVTLFDYYLKKYLG